MVEAAARGRGKRLLYWFRTPPGVRVGRAPIDETAIRLLEQHNPDVHFDWTRILKAPPPAESQGRRDQRETRDRDQRGRREPRSSPRPRSGAAPFAHPAPPPPPAAEQPRESRPAEPAGAPERTSLGEAADHEAFPENAPQAAELPHDDQTAAPAPHDDQAVAHADTPEALDAAAPREPRAPRASAEPEEVFEARPEDVGSPSYARLGAEGLVRLRARYADVMARIAERPLEEEARAELKLRAQSLNPDGWVTADEVTAALEQYETVVEELRGVVGRHPSRRRRRR